MKNFDLESIKKKLYKLWGTTIYNFEFNIILHNLRLYVISPSDNGNEYYELRFLNIYKIIFDKPQSHYGWSYAELSEIEVNQEEGRYIVEILLWFDETKLVIECEKIEFVSLLSQIVEMPS